MRKRLSLLISLLVGFLLLGNNVGAYQDQTHRNLTQKAITYMIEKENLLQSCPVYQAIEDASVAEDYPSIRSLFHFSPSIQSTYAIASCDSITWAFSGDICEASVLSYPSIFLNNYDWQWAIRGAGTNDGWVALGHVLHLLQDMAVPAHTRNDPHPIYDPLERKAEKLPPPVLLHNVDAITVADPQQLFQQLRDYTQSRHFSSDTCFHPNFLGPVAVSEDSNYFFDASGRKIAYKGKAYKLSKNRRDATIDTVIAEEQFLELGPLAVLYAASLIKHYSDITETFPCPVGNGWVKVYPRKGKEFSQSVQQTADGGYIIGGSAVGFVPGSEAMYLIKTDATGKIQWDREYGGYDAEWGYSVRQTNDKGFIFTGHTTEGGVRMVLIKTDSEGQPQWQRSYLSRYGAEKMAGYDVQQTQDGGYIVASERWSEGSGRLLEPGTASLVKTHPDGNVVWEASLGKGTSIKSVTLTPDGGYVATGNIGGLIYLAKVDQKGTMRWRKTFGQDLWNMSLEVQATSDGGFIIVGEALLASGSRRVYLIKTDASGKLLWDKTYGGERFDFGQSVKQTRDGGYIVIGYTVEKSTTDARVSLIKTDSQGTMQWSRAHSLGDNAWGSSVWQTRDGGYIATGYTCSMNGSECDIFLMKTDGEGNI